MLSLEQIADASDDRGFGADDGQIDLFSASKLNEIRKILCADGDIFAELVRAGVAGGDIELREPGRPCEPPGQSMLASAGTDEEDFHRLGFLFFRFLISTMSPR
jgi:hypothetical protein